jgi:hypothetical protein
MESQISMPDILFLKLTLVPAMIGTVSLAGRRWGPSISGWLVGLPLTSAPVVLFLALEQGNVFASAAAQGVIIGLIPSITFCMAYVFLSYRLKWLGTLLGGLSVYLGAALIFERVWLPPLFSFALVVSFLAVVFALLPKNTQDSPYPAPPKWEVVVRMGTATVLVLAITGVAPLLGAQLTGLLTPFPLYTSILAVFTHRFHGQQAVSQLIRGVVVGSFTFAVFFLIVAATIEDSGLEVFALASLVAVSIHASSLILLKRKTSRLDQRHTG